MAIELLLSSHVPLDHPWITGHQEARGHMTQDGYTSHSTYTRPAYSVSSETQQG
jgi:hypothetical protein